MISESANNSTATQLNPNTGIPEVCEPKKTGFAKWWPLVVGLVVGGVGTKAYHKFGKKGK